ncbi:hypothetical protein Dimus_032909 [Dionaea muscipula]
MGEGVDVEEGEGGLRVLELEVEEEEGGEEVRGGVPVVGNEGGGNEGEFGFERREVELGLVVEMCGVEEDEECEGAETGGGEGEDAAEEAVGEADYAGFRLRLKGEEIGDNGIGVGVGDGDGGDEGGEDQGEEEEGKVRKFEEMHFFFFFLTLVLL